MAWHAVDNGSTIGQAGSENDHRLGRGACGWRCGIYGFTAHTRFFADRASAEAGYEAMKPALQAIQSFVEQFP
jgi:hypothetical protein